ncbi:MAG: hypothetical protein M1360_02370 [Candidatus Marsarchaeota archaeon]|jgi:hypothetical protein|nr:hypothetical protein [Candidatus Marsarchaeota archaeon]MCL5418763.1 hypothetical protein [Candidatus Marsarchaeota archaeon]
MKNAIYLVSLLAFTMMLAVSFASSAIGVSFPKVAPSHVTLYLNDSTTVAFSFVLYNGTAGTTCIGIPNSPQLQANGTYTSVSPPSGVPPFNGTMYITTKPNAVPGNYTVQLAGGCADPTNHGIAVVYLTVLPQQKPVTITTTVATTTVPSNSITSSVPPTTTPPTTIATVVPPPITTTNNTTLVYILVVIIVIAIIVIIAAFYKMRHRY